MCDHTEMFPVTFDAPSPYSRRNPYNECSTACQFCGDQIRPGDCDGSPNWPPRPNPMEKAVTRVQSMDRALCLNLPDIVLKRVFDFEYDPNDDDDVYRAKWFDDDLQWCPACHRISDECCTSSVNGCAFDDHWSKAPISYTIDGVKTQGSIVVPPDRLFQFAQLMRSKRITLEMFCSCPGFCPQASNSRTKPAPGTRGDHNTKGFGLYCCRRSKLPELVEKYPTLQQQLEYARTPIPWPLGN